VTPSCFKGRQFSTTIRQQNRRHLSKKEKTKCSWTRGKKWYNSQFSNACT